MNSELWTAYEAAAATGGILCIRGEGEDKEPFPEETWSAKGISIDTRTIKPGEIFVAIKDVRDGHEFLKNAFNAGASAAIVSRAPENMPNNAPLLMVGDTLRGLEKLASAARDRCFGKFIAITGSVGKTSTKEMMRHVLAPSGKVHCADKSFNNHLGVPLTLAALPSDSDYGVFEIGMNHAGEITPLTKLVKPHVAIVTTVAPAHLEFFENVEAIAEAKAEIFFGVRRGGTVVLPRDNEHFDLLAKRAKEYAGSGVQFISFGEREGADFRMLNYSQDQNDFAEVTASIFGEEITYKIGITGKHQAMNSLAVLAGCYAVDANLDQAIASLAAQSPVEGRGLVQSIRVGPAEILLIDESYNANPVSMRAALKGASTLAVEGRRIALLGEMHELGDNAINFHLNVMEDLIDGQIDLVFAAGEMFKPMYEKLPESMKGGWASDASQLIDPVVNCLQQGDAVIAKGSNASAVHKVVKALKDHAANEGVN